MDRVDVGCQTISFADKIDVEKFLMREFPNKREILVSELSEAYFEIFGIR